MVHSEGGYWLVCIVRAWCTTVITIITITTYVVVIKRGVRITRAGSIMLHFNNYLYIYLFIRLPIDQRLVYRTARLHLNTMLRDCSNDTLRKTRSAEHEPISLNSLEHLYGRPTSRRYPTFLCWSRQHVPSLL